MRGRLRASAVLRLAAVALTTVSTRIDPGWRDEMRPGLVCTAQHRPGTDPVCTAPSSAYTSRPTKWKPTTATRKKMVDTVHCVHGDLARSAEPGAVPTGCVGSSPTYSLRGGNVVPGPLCAWGRQAVATYQTGERANELVQCLEENRAGSRMCRFSPGSCSSSSSTPYPSCSVPSIHRQTARAAKQAPGTPVAVSPAPTSTPHRMPPQ
jgi:hypothetical protein